MYEKLNLVSKTRGLESRIKIFLFNKSTMIHPGFVQCNVQTNLAREKDGGGNILWWRECMSFLGDLLPPLITLRRKGSLEHPPPVTILPGYFYLLSSDGKYIFLSRLKPFFLQGGRGRIGERIVPTGES